MIRLPQSRVPHSASMVNSDASGSNGNAIQLEVSYRCIQGSCDLSTSLTNVFQPIGFFMYTEMSGTDPSKWKLLKVCIFKQVWFNYSSMSKDRVQSPNILQRRVILGRVP